MTNNMMERAKIDKTYKPIAVTELCISWNGYRYLVVIGRHVNGWYIAIPNWSICIESSHPTDSYYNSDKIGSALDSPTAGLAIADAISTYWRSIEKEKFYE